MLEKVAIKDNGEVDYGVFYLNDIWSKRLNLPIRLLSSAVFAFTPALILYSNHKSGIILTPWETILTILLGVVLGLLVYYVSWSLVQMFILLHLNIKEGDRGFNDTAKEYFDTHSNKALCYLQEVEILRCESKTRVKTFSYKPIAEGCVVRLSTHSTDTVEGVVVSNKAIFNRAYFDHVELMESDIIA